LPFTFPSHPGLILPLWITRPARLDGLAVALGAVLPDFLDAAVEWPSGNLSINFSHSLLGLVILVIPAGFVLMYAADGLLRGIRSREPAGGRPSWRRGRGARARGDGELLPRASPSNTGGRPWLDRLVAPRFFPRRVLLSVSVGAASHLVFDALSHRWFDWLLPWARPDLLPPSLDGAWLSVRVRGMEGPLTFGLFTLLWVLWTLVGAALFVWCWRRALERESWR
jgi:hypothetical protein